MLAEFVYGAVPKETFNKSMGIDQGVPRALFYYLKRDYFPAVYFNNMVKGQWFGPKGWSAPTWGPVKDAPAASA
jgi:sulfide:quinone oxidoreductase